MLFRQQGWQPANFPDFQAFLLAQLPPKPLDFARVRALGQELADPQLLEAFGGIASAGPL